MQNSDSEVKLEMVDEGLDSVPVQGNLSSPYQPTSGNIGDPNFNSLDEPVRDTIMRDLKAVCTKFKHVIRPSDKKSILKDWDLWGPLLLCTLMAMILQGDENINDFHDGGPQFAEVFVIVWVGAMIVTLNSKLLGGNISFFQSVCVLGYCLLPMAIALICCKVVLMIQYNFVNGHYPLVFHTLRFWITLFALHWTCKAVWKFLADVHPSERRGLAMYPIFLFYTVIGWLVLSYSV
ncbi:protein YIPF6 [Halyomorpha halys]|uniref:protein YIPF6 n=1 Tax=Halyomorpha halys TaxID=286706 RepID=UPI0006D4FED5|nr:protein YIPF6 [Halyomorpha halys]